IFPEVEDTGAVLNAFAEEAEREIQLGPEVRELDRICRIERGPTARYRGKDHRWFRGAGLAKLVERFRGAMSVPAEGLIRNRINSPFFERAPEVVRDELDRVTRVNLDLTGDGPPIQPLETLRDADFHRARGGMLAELRRLICLLEKHPHTVLNRIVAEGA